MRLRLVSRQPRMMWHRRQQRQQRQRGQEQRFQCPPARQQWQLVRLGCAAPRGAAVRSTCATAGVMWLLAGACLPAWGCDVRGQATTLVRLIGASCALWCIVVAPGAPEVIQCCRYPVFGSPGPPGVSCHSTQQDLNTRPLLATGAPPSTTYVPTLPLPALRLISCSGQPPFPA